MPVPDGGEPRLRVGRRRCGVPGYFRADLHAGRAGDARRLDRAVGHRSRAATRRTRCDAETERRRSLLAIAGAGAGPGSPRELVLAADQFIITPAGRVEDAARARAAGDEVRTVIAGYHWFTDWGRDTMISLEGLTLCDRPLPRGRLHPAHLRALRPRRPDPEHVPRRRARGPVSHRRRDAVVLPRGRALRPRHRRQRDAALLLPTFARHRRARTSRARASASASIRPTACCARGRRATSSPGWTRRSTTGWSRRAAARRSRSTRSGTTRCGCSTAGCASSACDDGGLDLAAHADRARDVVQRALLVRDGAAISTTSSTASSGDDPACRPNQVFAISLDHPVLDRERWEPVMRRRARAAAHAGRPALARARASRLQGRSTTAICASRDAAYHQGTVWAWLIGPFVDAWLKVHPDDRAGARELLDGFERAPRRGVRRLDQRDLRRRGAVRAARLRRAGLERRRGAALPGRRPSASTPDQRTAARARRLADRTSHVSCRS